MESSPQEGFLCLFTLLAFLNKPLLQDFDSCFCTVLLAVLLIAIILFYSVTVFIAFIERLFYELIVLELSILSSFTFINPDGFPR